MSQSKTDFKQYLDKVYQSEKLFRLKDILGFTGLGTDLNRKYIDDIAVYHHDLRVANVWKQLVQTDDPVDTYKVQFIGLTHDYSAFPFRQFALKGKLKEIIDSTGFKPKARIVELLEEDGLKFDETSRHDLLNFDIAEEVCKTLSAECKVAVSCESVVTVYEDIILALKYEIISHADIPGELMNKLKFPNEEILRDRINEDFSKLIEDLSVDFSKRNYSDVKSLEVAARDFKFYARTNFIVEHVFKEKDKKNDIHSVENLYDKYFECFVKDGKNQLDGAMLNDLSTRTESFLLKLTS